MPYDVVLFVMVTLGVVMSVHGHDHACTCACAILCYGVLWQPSVYCSMICHAVPWPDML